MFYHLLQACRIRLSSIPQSAKPKFLLYHATIIHNSKTEITGPGIEVLYDYRLCLYVAFHEIEG